MSYFPEPYNQNKHKINVELDLFIMQQNLI